MDLECYLYNFFSNLIINIECDLDEWAFRLVKATTLFFSAKLIIFKHSYGDTTLSHSKPDINTPLSSDSLILTSELSGFIKSNNYIIIFVYTISIYIYIYPIYTV